MQALPNSLTSLVPATIGVDYTATLVVGGVIPTSSSRIAWTTALNGCNSPALRVADSPLSSTTVVLASTFSIANDNYYTCYSTDGTTYVRQTGPVTLSVVRPFSTAIFGLSPPAVGRGTLARFDISGARLTPATFVAFTGNGDCSPPNREGTTQLVSADSFILDAGLGNAGPMVCVGVFVVCVLWE